LDRVALLAHQLRTPLSAINALAQGLIRRADQLSTHDVRAKAEKIWRASLRLDELTETILSYSRATAGGIVLNPTEFSLDELIRRVCREQGGQDPSRAIQLQLRGLRYGDRRCHPAGAGARHRPLQRHEIFAA
jgi:signal transduction histidine kinase